MVTVSRNRNWTLAFDRPDWEEDAWSTFRVFPGDVALVVCVLCDTVSRGRSALLVSHRGVGWVRATGLVPAMVQPVASSW